MRVVSLVPSVTETLLAWGVTPVACTRFCEQPTLPHVGGTKDPDIAAIVNLAVDVVVLDDEENRREDAEALERAGVPIHVTHVRSVGDVVGVLAGLARAVGASFDPEAFLASMPLPRAPRWTAFVPIWRRPWMTLSGDTYGASALAACGVVTLFADSTVRYPEVDLADAAARHPDVVLLPSEPYPFAERHLAQVESVAPRRAIVDGHDLFWWGTRTPAALARLAECVDTLGLMR